MCVGGRGGVTPRPHCSPPPFLRTMGVKATKVWEKTVIKHIFAK